jgi:hypothetical protein
MYLALFGSPYHSGPYLGNVLPEKISHHDADCPHAQSIGENRFECKKTASVFLRYQQKPAGNCGERGNEESIMKGI